SLSLHDALPISCPEKVILELVHGDYCFDQSNMGLQSNWCRTCSSKEKFIKVLDQMEDDLQKDEKAHPISFIPKFFEVLQNDKQLSSADLPGNTPLGVIWEK